MILVLLIAAGGAGGALVHYAVTQAVTDARRVLMLTGGTCVLLGFVTAASPPQWFTGLVCFGFLGALAPMSSVAWVTVTRLRERRYRAGLTFLAACVVSGVACAMFGFLLYSAGLTLHRKF
ncbi:hypothetical protein QMK17_18145 [Rhodococcus sp. G-MC3]|uniref:hypothetical protein n=1 Tax=Rhodococcus sp. G-MC3 TaxID=3046209 RepID=UPI0024B9B83F|nr:hypothetical protein [Rhodococcus sp. G-MC3]MDJ0395251.1 hypothetical protein [Rhodococcus sp. G-MC3]